MAKKGLGLIVMVLLVVIGVEFGYYYYISKLGPTAVSRPGSPAAESTPTSSPGSAADRVVDFTNSEPAYRFQYYRSWKIETQASLLKIFDPDNAKNYVVLSPLPYASSSATVVETSMGATPVLTQSEQADVLIKQLAKDSPVTSFNTPTLNGSQTTTMTGDGKTVTVVFPGTHSLFLLRLPDQGQGHFSNGQLLILNTLKED